MARTSCELPGDGRGAVGAPVVHDDHVDGRMVLGLQGVEGFAQRLFCVVRRDDDGDESSSVITDRST